MKPKHDTIERRNGKYIPWWRGRSYGSYDSYSDAQAALWNGPIGKELVDFQNEMWIQWEIERLQRRLAKQQAASGQPGDIGQHSFLED